MRYKEFNPNQVLEKCIPLFWSKGFGLCPISEIVEVTGVNRFSLYEEFDNKEGILYAALDLYNERYASKNLNILSEGDGSQETITNFFKSYLTGNERHPPGCFIIQMATELADSNEQVRQILDAFLDTLNEGFQRVLVSNNYSQENAAFYARHLSGLFCTSISFCLIHTYEERLKYVENGINVIFQKSIDHAPIP